MMTMDKAALQIVALLVQKQEMDASRDTTLNMSIGSNAEHQWVLDAIAFLLQAELDRREK